MEVEINYKSEYLKQFAKTMLIQRHIVYIYIATGLFILYTAILFGYDKFTTARLISASIGIAVIIIFYFLSYYQYLRAFKEQYKNPKVFFKFEDERIFTENDEGTSEIKWTAFKEIWKFDNYWFLFLNRHKFIPLPLECLSEEIKKHIDKMTEEYKIKIK